MRHLCKFEVQDSSDFSFLFFSRVSVTVSVLRVSRDKLTLQSANGHLGSSHSDFFFEDFFLISSLYKNRF